MPSTLVLKFLAPIPVGHAVTVYSTEEEAFFGGWKESDPLVVDETTGILYGPEWTPDSLHGAYVELEGATQRQRRVSPDNPPLRARVVTCQLRSKGWGEHNDFATILGLEPAQEPGYRSPA